MQTQYLMKEQEQDAEQDYPINWVSKHKSFVMALVVAAGAREKGMITHTGRLFTFIHMGS